MDRTACTEPQCLYKGALYPYLTYCIPGVHKFSKNLEKISKFYIRRVTRSEDTRILSVKGQNLVAPRISALLLHLYIHRTLIKTSC